VTSTRVSTPLLIALLLAFLSACGPGGIDWEAVERDILRDADGAVLTVEYDPADDFVTVVVTPEIDAAAAAALLCETVLPILDEAGSIALFAAYTESGSVLASWNRCDLGP
jgi:hypothetical protein